jgi:histidine decarboxylase
MTGTPPPRGAAGQPDAHPPIEAPIGAAVDPTLAELREYLDADRSHNIGFPATFGLDYSPLWPFFSRLLNNIGDPYDPSGFPANTKQFEREVVAFLARLLRLPEEDTWGYVTTGGTEGNEYGLLLARELYPNGIVYHSADAHYSVPKLAAKLRMPAIALRTGPDGSLKPRDLRAALRAQRDKPAIVVATVGTTMTEAVDDVTVIRETLADLAIRRAHVHADAALSGVPLALLPPESRPGFDFADGADSISISGHKFLGAPFPCGVILTYRSLKNRIGASVDYVSTNDTTIGGSRSGHAPLLLWYVLSSLGVEGLRERADYARRVAAYATEQLNDIGWPAWRHPHAFTVVMEQPPEHIVRKWRLASSNGRSHLICMPSVAVATIDAFVDDLAALEPTELTGATALIRSGDIEPGDLRSGDIEPGDLRPGGLRPRDLRPGGIRPSEPVDASEPGHPA